MGGINIPGVTDQYKTNDTVEKLMKIERIPLTREQDTLKSYQTQRDAWRDVNRKMSALRDSVKNLYSYDNPFNNKLADSSDERAITAEAGHGAAYESFKVDVLQRAASDRMLSDELEADGQKVPAGNYTFKVADKSVTLKWSGGTLKDFATAITRRGGGMVKSSVIGASSGKKTLLVESLKTGAANRLIFEGDAHKFALDTGLIVQDTSRNQTLTPRMSAIDETTEGEGQKAVPLEAPPPPSVSAVTEQEGMMPLTADGVETGENGVTAPPRSSLIFDLPEVAPDEEGKARRVTFTVTREEAEDIADILNKRMAGPTMPDAGTAEYQEIIINNDPSNPMLPPAGEPLDKILTDNVFFAVMADGTEEEIDTKGLVVGWEMPEEVESEQGVMMPGEDTPYTVDFALDEYPDIRSIAVRNRNTGVALVLSEPIVHDAAAADGYVAKNPADIAQDAVIKYEGITIRRPNNDIDDIVPAVTLHVHDKTEKTATITIKPDKETSKDALITFVGKYNEALAEVNVLSQNKSEIIEELTYLSNDEREKQKDKLGMFLSDFTLSSVKSSLMSQTTAKSANADAKLLTLAQMGISTSATGYSGYSGSRLRGYLEIDEKKLDSALENNLDDIKDLFGYDSDGDLVVDTGVAYTIDRTLESYTRTGGVFANKTTGLDNKIKASERNIARLETQMDKKEAELKEKYAAMEGSLNALEREQTTISNFQRRNNADR